MLLGCAIALCSTGCVSLGSASEQAVLRAKNRVAPALVHIRPVKEVFAAGRREETLVVGSGFIISPDGYVVTNEHVAGKSQHVRCVLYDKSEVDAEVIGTDPYTDLAVLKLTTTKALPHATLGTSRAIESGQTVLALGSPHGLARSVSLGIVSVPDRYLGDQGEMVSPYNTWIQTDAAINQGNSGGPLVNLRGEVVGVNARVLRGAENVGFAIPIDAAKHVIADIIAHGRVTRSWLGLSLQEMMRKTDDPEQQGVVIADVDPLSPGHHAGIMPGDILVAINGQAVHARFEEDLPEVRTLIATAPVGSEATLRILRAGELITVTATTMEQSQIRGRELELAPWGFSGADVTPEVARQVRLATVEGVRVTGTQPGGLGAGAGLAAGDIVLKIDDEPVRNLESFHEQVAQRVESDQPRVLLFVKRGAVTRYVLLKQGLAADAADELGLDVEDTGLVE
jgi:serine protease Do